MFQSYVKVAWRNLLRNKAYSFINIGGLALGMTVALLIGLWVNDGLSFDKYHKNYDRLVCVWQHRITGGVKRSGIVVPMPLEHELRTKFGSDFDHLAMVTWEDGHILSHSGRVISKTGNYAQPEFPEMMSLEMIRGDHKAFHNPSSMFIARSAAIALFGTVDALNEIVLIDNNIGAKVTGVYEDLPHNTSFRSLEFIGSWDLYMASEWPEGPNRNWNDNFLRLFGQLAPNASIDIVSEKIRNVKLDHIADKSGQPEVFLNPMSNWYLRSEWKDGVNAGGRIQVIRMVGTIGAFVLLLACVNFMNLSTARAEKRSKEVGIRLTIGSMRRQLIGQFMSESFLVVSISFVMALVLSALLLPWFNELTDKKISTDWSDPYLWSASALLVVVTCLVAGWYPALYLSSLKPLKAIKASRFATLPRKILVVFQFSISVGLTIATVVVYQQVQFSGTRPVGYDQSHLVSISMKSPDFKGKLQVLQTMLKDAGAIDEMAQSSSPITSVWNNSNEIRWQGKDPAKDQGFGTIMITPEYGKTVGWTIVEGRDVSRDIASDTLGVVLNEAAVDYMEVKDPVGMEIEWGRSKFHVIGVVRNLVAESPYNPVRPAIYFVNEKRSTHMLLKLNPAKSVKESLATIEQVFKKVIPSAPFEYKFVDDEYARKFNSERRIGRLTLVFTIIAIVISCLGLFGLASFVAGQKVKEIGIRKVLGASVRSLWQMLSRDFVLLAGTACLISIPMALYFMNDWLAQFQYRTDVSWSVVLCTAAGAILVTLITVSFQTVKAAATNPVKSLRSE